MPEVLEIEQETEQAEEAPVPKWNSWVMEMPKEIVEANNLPEGTLVALTLRNNRVEGEIIKPSSKTKKSVERFVEKNREFIEEMKRIGD